MFGDLLKTGSKLFGIGGGGGGSSGLLGLGMNIFGGSKDDPAGFFGSPIFGSILGAVGGALMQPTSEEEIEHARGLMRANLEEKQRYIRSNYGLGPTPDVAGYFRSQGIKPDA